MKSIWVSNETRKKLLRLRSETNCRNDNQLIELLLNSRFKQSEKGIYLPSDILESLNDFKKVAHLKDMNQVIVNLLFNLSEETYKNLVKKYFS